MLCMTVLQKIDCSRPSVFSCFYSIGGNRAQGIARNLDASAKRKIWLGTGWGYFSSGQQPAGIKKCNHPRCLTCSFLREGQTNYTFLTTNEARKITDSISCHSKNLIYLIERERCHLQYIGETKRQLSERFGEHRRSILNHQQLSITTPVSLHLTKLAIRLIPIELIRSKRDSVRKAREAHLINKAKTLHPFGINKRDEAR